MLHRPLACLVVTLATATALAQAAPRQAMLKSNAGADAGTVAFTPAPKGMLLRVDAKGLTPGWHAIHVHEKGDCSDAAFKAAGAHTHGGTASVHGLLNPQANDTGDLPNIHVAADGTAHAELFSTLLTPAALADTDGAAVIVHANPDDHRTQPIGGAGDRVACGVVR